LLITLKRVDLSYIRSPNVKHDQLVLKTVSYETLYTVGPNQAEIDIKVKKPDSKNDDNIGMQAVYTVMKNGQFQLIHLSSVKAVL